MTVVTKDVTSRGGVTSWRRQVVVKGALRLLCPSCGLKISIHSRGWFSKLMCVQVPESIGSVVF